MMPRKIIASRARSATARCDRWVYCDDGPHCYVRCGEPLILFVTSSPMPQYEQLVVTRCPEHIATGDGVLPESAESPWLDCGGTF